MKQVQELANLLSETSQKLKELINDEYKQKLIKKIKEEYNIEIEIERVIYSYGNTWINLWDHSNKHYVYWPGSDKFYKE